LGRVVNLQTAGKDRKQLMRITALAIRELNDQQEVTQETGDLAAFIALSLIAIHQTIDRSVEPWEKRGYWLKADRFRMDWAWSLQLGEKLKEGVLAEDWVRVALTVASITEKLQAVRIPKRGLKGKLWKGSMKVLMEND
jgi:hypothetical protein